MSIQSTAIDIAKSKNNYVEGPRRNQTIFAAERFPSVNFQPWCGSFVGWCYWKAGFDIGKYVVISYTPAIEAWARKNGFWVTDHPEEGDIVIYGFGADHAEHTGISWPDPGASGYRAIEGNTSSGNSGSQKNGGQVAIRYRGRKSIRGWVRISKVLEHYGANGAQVAVESAKVVASGSLEVDGVFGYATAREVQERLKKNVPSLVIDGKIGRNTLSAWQGHEGTPADGILSGQSNTAVKALPAFRRDCIKVENGGSRFVKTLQTHLAGYGYQISVDGVFGPATVKVLQQALNEHADALT